uniref:Uncharacterized protein n=1 Tax=Ditylum brightwellii TaxID=49249 RepID=A0A6V2KA81_9STRA
MSTTNKKLAEVSAAAATGPTATTQFAPLPSPSTALSLRQPLLTSSVTQRNQQPVALLAAAAAASSSSWPIPTQHPTSSSAPHHQQQNYHNHHNAPSSVPPSLAAPSSSPYLTTSSSNTNSVSSSSSVAKMRRERFQMFIRILMKYLEQQDRRIYARTRAMLKTCYLRNRSGDPAYSPSTLNMRTKLLETVGPIHWKKAEDYLNHFLSQKRICQESAQEQTAAAA